MYKLIKNIILACASDGLIPANGDCTCGSAAGICIATSTCTQSDAGGLCTSGRSKT